jgi:hypothetical protein
VLNVAEERLPRRFGAAAGEPINIVRLVTSSTAQERAAAATGASDAAAAAAAAVVAADAAEEDEAASDTSTALGCLTCRGYSAAEAATALAAAGDDAPAALRALFGALLRADAPGGDAFPAWPRAGGADAVDDGDAAADAEAWADECVALSAIFGEEDARVAPDGASAEIDVRCEGAGPGGRDVCLTLEVAPPAGGAYPRAPPLLALRAQRGAKAAAAARVPPAMLRALTARLAGDAAAAATRVEPCAHELASGLPDALAALLAEGGPAAAWAAPASAAAGDGAASKASLPAPRRAPGAAGAAPPPAAGAAPPQAAFSAGAAQQQQRRGGGGGRGQDSDGASRGPRRSPGDIARESTALAAALVAYSSATHGPAVAMRAARARLPAAEARQAVVTAVASHRVVVLSGETGCGKSTQVPQFLLEAAAADGAGGECSIVVTQPRRISAIGLAERVAAERCEPCGAVVGYAVRLEARRSERTRLLFCTTGILLRRLLNDPDLSDVSHVMLDEVHERSLESDLLLLLLRVLLRRRPTLRIILMSATADSGLFARYFADALPGGTALPKSVPRGAPAAPPTGVTQIHIPVRAHLRCVLHACTLHQSLTLRKCITQRNKQGFTHPVAEYYLEDVLERTGFLIGRGSRYARKRKPTAGLVDVETGEEVPAEWQNPDDAIDAEEEEEEEEAAKAAKSGGSGADAGVKGARKGKAGGAKAAAAEAEAEAEGEAAPESVPDSWDEAPSATAAPSRLTRAPSASALPAAKPAAESWADASAPAVGSAAAASAAASAAARAVSDAAARARRDAEALADQSLAQYSDATRRSVANVDDTQINYGTLALLAPSDQSYRTHPMRIQRLNNPAMFFLPFFPRRRAAGAADRVHPADGGQPRPRGAGGAAAGWRRAAAARQMPRRGARLPAWRGGDQQAAAPAGALAPAAAWRCGPAVGAATARLAVLRGPAARV